MMLDKQRLRSFLLGGLTGILAGILLAPRSGRETRGNLADRAGEVRERGRERYFDTRENVRESFSANREGSQRFHQAEDEATVSPGANDEPFAEDEADRGRPVLRDVSRDFPPEEPRKSADSESADSESVDSESVDSESVDRSEELRRKVRETRERLRARSVGPEEGGESREGSPGGEEDEK